MTLTIGGDPPVDLEHERRLTEVEARSASNTKRLNKLEESTEAINRLATAVEVMATKQDTVGESVERLEHKVDTMEEKPAERWDKLISSLIGDLGGAFLVWVASWMPGGVRG
jgi:hypothetical protein